MFKEEVLEDLKQLDKGLAEKYRKTSQDVKDKLDIFDKKLNDFYIKLSDLSNKIIEDLKTHEKLSQLLIFKEKAQDIMTSNRVKLQFFENETRDSINRIDSLLKKTIFYPGIIGNQSKFKTFHEYIDYTLLQITLLNNFKDKNIMDFDTYKRIMKNSLNSIKFEIDNSKKEANFYCADNNKKTENKLLKELEYRDEKLQNVRIENQELVIKLIKETKEFAEDYNLIKDLKIEIDKELKVVKKNNIDYINKSFKNHIDKYNQIKNEINDLKNNIKNTINYLNREGAEIKFVKNDGEYNFNSNSDSDNIQESNLVFNTKKEIKSSILRKKSNLDIIYSNEKFKNIENSKNNTNIKDNNNNNNYENIEEKKNLEENISSQKHESDIYKYIKGEIYANEIGSSTKSHPKIISSHYQKAEKYGNTQEYKNNLINNNEYIEFNKNNKYNLLNKKNDINNKSKSNPNKNKVSIFYLNDVFDNSFHKTKPEKKLKRNIKSSLSHKNLMDIELRDLDVQYHGNNVSSTIEYKTIKTNEEIIKNYHRQNSNNNLNFNNILKNLNFSPKRDNFQNFVVESTKKINNPKNLTLQPPDNTNNNYNQKNRVGSSKNYNKFNKNNSLSIQSPTKNNKNNQIMFNDNKIIKSNNYILNLKSNQASKLNITKSLKNIQPLSINNINNDKYPINTFNTFNSISKGKTNDNYLNNIKSKK